MNVPGMLVSNFGQHQAVDVPVLAALPCPVVHDREGGEICEECDDCSAANGKLAAMAGGDHGTAFADRAQKEPGLRTYAGPPDFANQMFTG